MRKFINLLTKILWKKKHPGRDANGNKSTGKKSNGTRYITGPTWAVARVQARHGGAAQHVAARPQQQLGVRRQRGAHGHAPGARAAGLQRGAPGRQPRSRRQRRRAAARARRHQVALRVHVHVHLPSERPQSD